MGGQTQATGSRPEQDTKGDTPWHGQTATAEQAPANGRNSETKPDDSCPATVPTAALKENLNSTISARTQPAEPTA
ncbi:hypothetical protein HMPREF0307_02059 [Corynebacterium sp. DNF00584]|nr:hypothetical protein HMPREF0307_02059 [Corynebacterium sp. DNF00584]